MWIQAKRPTKLARHTGSARQVQHPHGGKNGPIGRGPNCKGSKTKEPRGREQPASRGKEGKGSESKGSIGKGPNGRGAAAKGSAVKQPADKRPADEGPNGKAPNSKGQACAIRDPVSAAVVQSISHFQCHHPCYLPRTQVCLYLQFLCITSYITYNVRDFGWCGVCDCIGFYQDPCPSSVTLTLNPNPKPSYLQDALKRWFTCQTSQYWSLPNTRDLLLVGHFACLFLSAYTQCLF